MPDGRTTRGSRLSSGLRARTALLLAPLVMLTSSSLGIVTAASASAAVGDPVPAPVLGAAPATPGTDGTPTWTYRLPADPAPVVQVSDSSTVTTTTTHTAECALSEGSPAPLAGGDCGTADPVDGSVSFTAPALADGPWRFAVATVRTTSTQVLDLTTGQSATGPPTVERSAATRSDVVVDTAAPVVALTRTSPAGADRVAFDLAVQDTTSTTTACATTFGAVTTCGPAAVVLDLPGEGAATLTVTVTDEVGLTGVQTAQVVLDRLDLAVDGPVSPGADDTPTWVLRGEPLASARCVLTTGGTEVAAADCVAGIFTAPPLPATTGTPYVLSVTATDAGNGAGTVASTPYVLDTLVELDPTRSPPARTNERRPVWTFTTEPGASVACTLTAATATAGTGTCGPTGYTAPLLPETTGTAWTLEVVATDPAGNVEAFSLGSTIVDTVLEAGLVAPPTPGSDLRPGWTLTGEPLGSVACALTDGGGSRQPGTCRTTGFRADGLAADGPYALLLDVVDLAGNTGQLSGGTYVLDRAVDVRLVRPAPVVRTRTPTWQVVGDEPLRDLVCTLTGPAGVVGGDCSDTAFTAAPLAVDGPYSLVVSGTDLAGNPFTTAASVVELDTRVEAAVAAPASPGNDTSPVWTLSGEPVTVVCRLVRGTVEVTGGTCSPSGYAAPVLPGTPGTTYALTLTVTDAVGNTEVLGPFEHVLDTQLVATTTSPRSPGNDLQPAWTVAGEPVSLTCTLTDGPTVLPGACGPTGFTADPLPATTGRDLVLELVLVDRAGNSRRELLAHRLDTVLELTVGSPATPGSGRRPSWTIGGEPLVAVTCVLQGPAGPVAGGTCTTTRYDAPTLDPGSYELSVTGTDSAGNTATVVAAPFELDTDVDLVVTGPTGPSADRTPAWVFTGERLRSVTCVLRAGTDAFPGSCSTSGFTAATLPTTTGTTYVLSVTAVDRAGNERTVVAAGYRLDTVSELEVTAPRSPDAVRTPRWAVRAEPGATVTCRLVGPAGEVPLDTCSRSQAVAAELPATTGASYVLTTTAVDPVGNSSVVTSPAYVLDTVLQLDVQGPAGPGNDVRPTWALVGEAYTDVTCTLSTPSGQVLGGDCRLDGYTAPELAATTGTDHVLTVRASDAAGNVRTVSSAVYRLDTVLELVVAGSRGPSPVRTPSWTFRGEPYATVACVLTGPDGAVVPGGTCDASGFTAPSLQVDGDHVLTVTVTDAAGNQQRTAVPYDLDSFVLTVQGPTGPSADRTPSWTFTDEPYTSASCVLTGPDGPVASGACTSTSGYTAPPLPLTPGATYRLTVTATDAVGTTGSATSAPYRLDTRGAVVTITGPTGAARVGSVAWTVAADEPVVSATCTLRRDGGALQALTCPGSTPVALTATGTYDVLVVVTDAAGTTTTATSAPYAFDAVAPAAPVVTPASVVTNDAAAQWTVQAEPGTDVTCRLSRDGVLLVDGAPCATGFARALETDGTHLLEVRATDLVGSGPTTTATWVLDRVRPGVPVLTGPTGPSPVRSPVWVVQADPGPTTCRLLRGDVVVTAAAPCTLPATTGALGGQPDGAYVLEATVADAAGNTSTGRSAPYVLDTTAPAAPVVSGPTGPSPLRSPVWTWTGEAGTTATCRLSREGVVDGPATACTSPYAPELPRDGTWSLAVVLTDAAGLASPPASSPAYLLDATAPLAPTVTPFAATGRNRVPAWSVLAETGTRLECRVTGPAGQPGPWAPCPSPVTTDLGDGAEGSYALEVRLTDAAGNLGPAGRGTYLLDTTAPVAPVVTAPASPGRSRAPQFTFATPPATTARCQVTSGTFVVVPAGPCTSPQVLPLSGLKDGPYALSVQLVDLAGNTGPAQSATYVLDTTGPAAPVLVTAPASPSSSRRPVWEFVLESGATALCRLVSASGEVRAATACSSPHTEVLTDLPEGEYVLSITAVDALGNVGGTLATPPYDLRRVAPLGPVVTAPASPSADRTPTWTFTGAFECQLARGAAVLSAFAPCRDGFTGDLFGRVDGTYVLTVRVPSARATETTSRYVLDTDGPAPAVVVAPDSPTTDSSPTWTVSSPEPGVTAECRVLVQGAVLPGEDWRPCPVSAAGALVTRELTRGDGTYTLVVRLTDAGGTRGAETRSDVVLDNGRPPAVGVLGPRPGPVGSDTTPEWTFLTAAGVPVECRLTGPDGRLVRGLDWAACASPFSPLLDSGEGSYVLGVRALSAAGVPGPEITSAYELDTVAPARPEWLVLPPQGGADRQPVFSFVPVGEGLTAVCLLTGPGVSVEVVPCGPVYQPELTGADGTYGLEVLAQDAAGNRSLPLITTYRLQVTPPPAPQLSVVPGSPSSTERPVWRFWTVPTATAQCRVVLAGAQLADFAACAGSYELALGGREDGVYELQVRSARNGLVSEVVTSRYDFQRTALPLPVLTSAAPSPGTDSTPEWLFTVPAGTTLACRPLGALAFGPCTSRSGDVFRWAPTVTGTGHAFEARVVDETGRTGPSTSVTYVRDASRPAAPDVVVSPREGQDRAPVWRWTDTPDLLVTCTLTGPAPTVTTRPACTDAFAASNLTRDGSWVLSVVRTTAAGTSSPVGSATYLLDTAAPPAFALSPRTPTAGTSRTRTWQFPVPPGTTALCRVTRGSGDLVDERSCSTGRFTLDLTGRALGTYVLDVLLSDLGGSTSSRASYTLVGSAVDPSVRLPDRPVTPQPPRDPVVRPPLDPPSDGPSDSPGTPGAPDDQPEFVGGARPRTAETLADDEAAAAVPDAPEPRDPGRLDLEVGGDTRIALPRLDLEDPIPDLSAVGDALVATARRPAVPLALLAIVALFLLAQNRIDRRDPKLAGGPVEAEPELDFFPFVRRPGGAT